MVCLINLENEMLTPEHKTFIYLKVFLIQCKHFNPIHCKCADDVGTKLSASQIEVFPFHRDKISYVYGITKSKCLTNIHSRKH